MAQREPKAFQKDSNTYVIDNGGTLDVQPGGSQVIRAGATQSLYGTQSVESGGVQDIKAGAAIKVAPGGSLQRTETLFINASEGHVGGTAGCVMNVDTGEVQCPASQTGAKWVLPVPGLKLGDVITGFKVIAQIESAGNHATLDCDLRKLTNVAADPTDASIGAITQVDVTADTAVAAAKTGLNYTVATGEMPYFLVALTTGASTDVRLQGIELTVDRK